VVFRLLYERENGECCCVCFSEEFFESFSWDRSYLERFAFLAGGNGEWRLAGEMRRRVGGLLDELRELSDSEAAGAAELEKLVLLRLLFVLEEGKAYLTAG
jgi:myosin-crossreactive antigen